MFLFALFGDGFSLIVGDDLLSKFLLDIYDFLFDGCSVCEVIFVISGEDCVDSFVGLYRFISVLRSSDLISYRVVQHHNIFMYFFVFAQKLAMDSYQ